MRQNKLLKKQTMMKYIIKQSQKKNRNFKFFYYQVKGNLELEILLSNSKFSFYDTSFHRTETGL